MTYSFTICKTSIREAHARHTSIRLPKAKAGDQSQQISWPTIWQLHLDLFPIGYPAPHFLKLAKLNLLTVKKNMIFFF